MNKVSLQKTFQPSTSLLSASFGVRNEEGLKTVGECFPYKDKNIMKLQEETEHA